MQAYVGKQERGSPENIVARVEQRLRDHVLWDSLLIYSPPLLAVLYLIADLYRAAWIPPIPVLLLASVVIVIGLVGVILRFRPRVPSRPFVAGLVDDKAEAKDRFMTLTTVDSSQSSEVMLDRLRREAMGLLHRIEIRRDFPYRPKRSFYWSMTGSVVVIVLFHLLFNSTLTKFGVPPQQRIRDLAEQMAQRPPLAEIARALQSLADKLDDSQVSREEKQAAIQEMQKQVEEQQKEEEQQDNKDLLSDAGSTLKSLEQETGGENQQQQQKEGGGVQSHASQESQGEGKESQDSGGETKGELSAQLNPEMKDGKSTQADPQSKGQQNNPGDQKEQTAEQPDRSNPEKSKTNESAGKMKESSEGKSGKNRSDEIPQDGAPAERYYKPGEQDREGIKGAKYVTVQLPEEIAANGNGVTTSSKDGKETRNRQRLPISNVPLPAHIPEAPAEKQRMPLEYRDLIR
jgi:hypothetical protein